VIYVSYGIHCALLACFDEAISRADAILTDLISRPITQSPFAAPDPTCKCVNLIADWRATVAIVGAGMTCRMHHSPGRYVYLGERSARDQDTGSLRLESSAKNVSAISSQSSCCGYASRHPGLISEYNRICGTCCEEGK
jgi:hypothetical protein